MSRTDKGWSDYWQRDGAGGEVFVNARGEGNPALRAYWLAVFEALPAAAKVVDLASGAGSIYAHLGNDHGLQLHAADIAEEALATLEERIPGVRTFVCGADDLPFDDGSFDLVVSQFGVEYAGADAFAEAARIVAPGGRLAALVHVKGGYIDAGNQEQLDEAIVTRDCGFIEHATELTHAVYSNSKARLATAEQAMMPAIEAVVGAMKRRKQGIHSYLYFGFRKLYENRKAYDKTDITGWLEGMNKELEINIDRLSRMTQAAMSEKDVDSIREHLQNAGLAVDATDLFETPGNDKPVAWDIRAHRDA